MFKKIIVIFLLLFIIAGSAIAPFFKTNSSECSEETITSIIECFGQDGLVFTEDGQAKLDLSQNINATEFMQTNSGYDMTLINDENNTRICAVSYEIEMRCE